MKKRLFLAKNLPIQIAGDPTEKIEVSNYKNLARVDTNFIRGGMCLNFFRRTCTKSKKRIKTFERFKIKGI